MIGTPVAIARAPARKRGKQIKRPEQELQIGVANMLRVSLPADCFWTFINNGMGRSKAEGGIAKAMGQRAGVPDLLFVYRGRALFIEMKAGKGKESPTQIECHGLLAMAGAPVATCRSVDEVIFTLKGWGVPVQATVMA